MLKCKGKYRVHEIPKVATTRKTELECNHFTDRVFTDRKNENPSRIKGSVTDRTDQENKVSKMFIISLG